MFRQSRDICAECERLMSEPQQKTHHHQPSCPRRKQILLAMNRYQRHVKTQCSRNPSLLNLLDFLSSARGAQSGCTALALDFRKGTDHPLFRTINRLDLLYTQLRASPFCDAMESGYANSDDHLLQGRIVIVEDLSKEVVEILGCELDIDPLFFAMHLHTAQKKGMHCQSPDSATLPSRIIPQNYLNIAYHRAITFDNPGPSERRLLRHSIIDRKVVVLPSTTIGLAQHCVSVHLSKRENNFWLGMAVPFYAFLWLMRHSCDIGGPTHERTVLFERRERPRKRFSILSFPLIPWSLRRFHGSTLHPPECRSP